MKNEEKLIDVVLLTFVLHLDCKRRACGAPAFVRAKISRKLFGFLKLTFSRKPQSGGMEKLYV